jgi:hypothetical protein
LRRAADFGAAESDYLAVAGTDASDILKVNAYRRFMLSGALPTRIEGNPPWLQIARRDAEALARIEAAQAETNSGSFARWRQWIRKCDSLRRLHREAEAVQAAQEAKNWMEKLNAETAFDPSERDGRLADTLARLGQADEAIAAGRRYVAARSPANQVRSRWEREIELAKVCAQVARPSDCCELVAKLLRVPSGLTVPMLKVDPTWDKVRDAPEFKALLADPKNSAAL